MLPLMNGNREGFEHILVTFYDSDIFKFEKRGIASFFTGVFFSHFRYFQKTFRQYGWHIWMGVQSLDDNTIL